MDSNRKDRYCAGIYGGLMVLLAYLISVPTEYLILWIVAMIWFFVSLKK